MMATKENTTAPMLSDEALAFMLQPALARGAANDISIPVITATTLKLPDVSDKVKREDGDRRSMDDIMAEREAKRAIAVGLAQPHRKALSGSLVDATNASSDFARLSTPLGRFCLAQRLRGECYQAGDEYAEVLRQGKSARGFPVIYSPRGEGGTLLTEQDLDTMREAAIIRERKCTEILISIHPRVGRVLEALCYDQREIAPHDEGLAAHGLLMLAKHLVGLDEGINRGKVGD